MDYIIARKYICTSTVLNFIFYSVSIKNTLVMGFLFIDF